MLGLSDHQWMAILALWLALAAMGYKKYYQGLAYVLVVIFISDDWTAFTTITIVYISASYIGDLLSVGISK